MLHKLLRKNQNFSPIYGRGRLANHMSMSLIAMHKIGASGDELQSFFEKHLKKLEPLSLNASSLEVKEANWEGYLGRPEYYQSYILFFKNAFKRSHIEAVLKKYLPVLMKGIASQGFHCAIRLAYSIEMQDVDEISLALAYFSSEFTKLKNMDCKKEVDSNPNQIIAKISQSKLFHFVNEKPQTIMERLLAIVKQKEFEMINEEIASSIIDLDECASIVSQIYASTKDFIALHMVTVTHALRLLIPYVVDCREILCFYWQAICAAYIAIGKPELNDSSQISSSNISLQWDEIFRLAIDSFDDHIIKLVYTCYEESQFYSNNIYHFLAESIVATR